MMRPAGAPVPADAVIPLEIVTYEGVMLAVEHPVDVVGLPGDAHAVGALVRHVEVRPQADRVLLAEHVEIGGPEDGTHVPVAAALGVVVGVVRLAAAPHLHVAVVGPAGLSDVLRLRVSLAVLHLRLESL